MGKVEFYAFLSWQEFIFQREAFVFQCTKYSSACNLFPGSFGERLRMKKSGRGMG